jgi:NTP pyrophosphatase (non-canonical NTP hydrolase)
MTFDEFTNHNLARCEAKDGFNHAINSWSLSDWLVALGGEVGEAMNIAKKLNRVRDGIPGNSQTADELRQHLVDELADVFIYLDIVASAAGFSLEKAVVEKFNRTSQKIGYPVTI